MTLLPLTPTFNPNTTKKQLGDVAKTPETGRNGRQKGRFFSSRPVTWCILVIRSQIAFIYLHICGFTSPKNYESRLTPTGKKSNSATWRKPLKRGVTVVKKGRFFSSRPVTWCILVIRSQIAFIYLHICGFTSPKNYESRLTPTGKKSNPATWRKPLKRGVTVVKKGRFFSSRPVTWCILVIRSQIAFIYLHICGFTSPKNYESRLTVC